LASAAEINRYLSQKLENGNIEEIDAVSAAQLLHDEGLLKDSVHRRGLPLRKLLRAGKIHGAHQYPNRRWVIRRSSKESIFSVKEAASELGLTQHAIYKRIERGLIKPEILGEKTIVIPRSEIIREQQSRNKETDIYNSGQFHYQISTIKQQLQQIQGEMDSVMKKISDLETFISKEDQNLTFTTIDELKKYGFEGFGTIESYQKSKLAELPSVKGVYLVLNLSGNDPVFMEKNSGGHFKGKDPTVEIEILKKKWIQDTIIVYIGQAGAERSKATLRSRIKQLVAFGNGKPVGHWGGRYLWQLKNSANLVLCWKATPHSDPGEVEHELIRSFIAHYGALPFANLKE
jgi:predicted DNA-binding transcriptional regulator AlpA